MHFGILLDNSSHSYFPGQIVTGKVFVHQKDNDKIIGLQMKCVGEAKTEFGVVNRSMETFFHYRIHLLNSQGQENKYFPFSFQLPMRAPSSFEGPKSKSLVQYYMTVTVQRSWKFDTETTQKFNVLGPFDLNLYPGLANPVQIRKQQQLGVLFLKSGPYGFLLRLSRTGYVPGEFLDFNLEIYNKSSRQIPRTTIKLVQVKLKAPYGEDLSGKVPIVIGTVPFQKFSQQSYGNGFQQYQQDHLEIPRKNGLPQFYGNRLQEFQETPSEYPSSNHSSFTPYPTAPSSTALLDYDSPPPSYDDLMKHECENRTKFGQSAHSGQL